MDKTLVKVGVRNVLVNAVAVTLANLNVKPFIVPVVALAKVKPIEDIGPATNPAAVNSLANTKY